MARTAPTSSRNFILTLNPRALEYYADILEYLKSLSGIKYILVCEHFGQENQHYHIYVQYDTSKRLSIRRLKGAHVERCFGSAQQNIKYLKAEDDKHKREGVTSSIIYEEGTPRLNGTNFTVQEIIDLDDVEVRELPSNMYNTATRIRRECRRLSIRDFRKNVKVYFIQGPSGVGKTNKAFEIAEEFEREHGYCVDMIKYDGSFYHGVTHEAKVAIYDDFRDSHMKPSEFINLIDYNRHWLNVKNGSELNNYYVIIFTSVQRFSKIYRKMNDEEPRLQWERRVEVIDMFPPERVHIGGLPVGYRTEFNQLEEYEVTDDWDGTRTVIM